CTASAARSSVIRVLTAIVRWWRWTPRRATFRPHRCANRRRSRPEGLSHSGYLRQSQDPFNPRNRNAGRVRPTLFEQTPRLLLLIGFQAGSQQGELDQVVLRPATANALVLTRERGQCLDRRGEVLPLECREAARQRG